MASPVFAAVIAAAAQHDQPDLGTDADGLCAAYDDAQRSGEEVAPLPEGVSCIPKGRGYALTPTAEVRLVELANATVATPDSEAFVVSDEVVHLEEVR